MTISPSLYRTVHKFYFVSNYSKWYIYVQLRLLHVDLTKYNSCKQFVTEQMLHMNTWINTWILQSLLKNKHLNAILTHIWVGLALKYLSILNIKNLILSKYSYFITLIITQLIHTQ